MLFKKKNLHHFFFFYKQSLRNAQHICGYQEIFLGFDQ